MRNIIEYRFPLADGTFVTLFVPDDLTVAEVAKIAAVLQSAAIDYTPPSLSVLLGAAVD